VNFASIFSNIAILWWLGILSVVTFVGTLIIIPVLVIRIPANYFMYEERWRLPNQRPRVTLRLLGLLFKNLLGVIFIVAGLIMLLLPGQGIITILIGIMLMNFPGKRTLEQRLVQQPTVLRTLNWIRAKAGQPPLVVPTVDAHPKATTGTQS
jgi:predicted RND superfamily exporter protein